jgi:hypothetical protein
VWDDYGKRNGTLKGKQARDLVYESFLLRRPFSIDKYFSKTVAEAWVVLQVEYRYQLGINVDYKAAQREGEWRIMFLEHLIDVSRSFAFFFHSKTRCPGCP